MFLGLDFFLGFLGFLKLMCLNIEVPKLVQERVLAAVIFVILSWYQNRGILRGGKKG